MMARCELKQLVQTLMSESSNFSEMKEAADQLYALFSETSRFEDSQTLRSECVMTQNGKAISPFEAGMCVKEFFRTRQFLKGFELAIKEAQRLFPNEVIKILYAGTGPFATLMLPMTTLFSDSEIQFTLLEINAVSLGHLEQVIDYFDVRPYVIEIIGADAARYQLNNPGEHHILITETMQRALKKEPQVAITLNLLPQIHENGLLVPACISVNLALVDSQRDMERMQGVAATENDYFYDLGTILDFNKQTALAIALAKNKGEVIESFECQLIELPEYIDPRFKHLNMMTTIQVFEEVLLTHNQCSLNLYERVKLDSSLANLPEKLSFEYELNDKPQIKWRVDNQN